jgi:hypothetical protein
VPVSEVPGVWLGSADQHLDVDLDARLDGHHARRLCCWPSQGRTATTLAAINATPSTAMSKRQRVRLVMSRIVCRRRNT